jgi:hypothetical protein
MNNQDEIINLKAELKKELIDYFDGLKFEIDIEAIEQNNQAEFNSLLINKNVNLTKLYSQLTQSEIIQMQMELVDLIDKTCDTCMNDLNRYFSVNNIDRSLKLEDKDQIKSNALKNYCIYFKYEELMNNKKL